MPLLTRFKPYEVALYAALLSTLSLGSSSYPHVFKEEPLAVLKDVRVELVEGESAVYCDGVLAGETPITLALSAGNHDLRFTRDSYADQTAKLRVEGSATRVFRHQQEAGPWRNLGVYRTGRQPKQVSFTPDGRYLIVTLLDDTGFDVIDLACGGQTLRVSPGLYGAKRGFVESIMCPERGTFWVSQMTTGLVYEYALPTSDGSDPRLLRVLSAKGQWTKTMAVDPAYRYLVAANWVSGSVSVLDYASGRNVARLAGLKAPRGLVFSPDGAFLYVCAYEDGCFLKIDTQTWKIADSWTGVGAAPRHVALSADGRVAYVSDMHGRRVLRFDTEKLAVTGSYPTDRNPNTIALSSDGKRLFVSCRGRNNSESYLLRSPEDGTVIVFDLATGKREAILRGGNQPTGLDLSLDGRILAFTSFLDDRVELYELADSSETY